MITFMESKEKVTEGDNCLDSEFWHACAGGMVRMPAVNSKVFYFVQGHIEHASGSIDFRSFPRIPPYIQCKVLAIKYLADHETDEVYAVIKLVPVTGSEPDYVDEESGVTVAEQPEIKPASFAKTLTQSDANNGGGFSVPRYCAETIFPGLDYTSDPPVQNILAKDVHGEPWKFRHIYRGTPRRHLLTTGWSTFVNAKKLIAGDSIVFLKTDSGDLRVGIRRAKRGIGVGQEPSPGWNPAAGLIQYGGFTTFLKEEENRFARNTNGSLSSNTTGKGKVKAESVVEAATYAANGQTFEVLYYPRAGTPEFVVKAALVNSAMQIRWCSGMRFKMPFETEDSSRTSWFMGTISTVQFCEPSRWPDSPWRLLQVTWDEPDLLQNVKRVSPWLVELVTNMPSIHLSPFSPPRKKFRLPQHPDYPMDGLLPMPPTSPVNFLGPGNPFGCLPDNSPAGMQGARHAQYGFSLSELHFNKFQSGLFPPGFPGLDPAALVTRPPNCVNVQNPSSKENISCLLTMGHSTQPPRKCDEVKRPHIKLFGKTITPELQMSLSCSGDTASPVQTGNSSDGIGDKTGNTSDGAASALNQSGPPVLSSTDGVQWYKDSRQEIESELDTGHCKVFVESEDVGRTLDLSLLKSYEELCSKLAQMFRIQGPDLHNRVFYKDVAGSDKLLGEEQFSEFSKRAKRLTILTDSGGDNIGA